jgi:hypothetical protein
MTRWRITFDSAYPIENHNLNFKKSECKVYILNNSCVYEGLEDFTRKAKSVLDEFS